MNAERQRAARDACLGLVTAGMALREALCAAIQPLIPVGFSGRLQITIDGGRVCAENVLLEMRPSQRKTHL